MEQPQSDPVYGDPHGENNDQRVGYLVSGASQQEDQLLLFSSGQAVPSIQKESYEIPHIQINFHDGLSYMPSYATTSTGNSGSNPLPTVQRAMAPSHLSQFASQTPQLFLEAATDPTGIDLPCVESALDNFDHYFDGVDFDYPGREMFLNEFQLDKDHPQSALELTDTQPALQLSDIPSAQPSGITWDWKSHRPQIKKLYVSENKSLKEVMSIMSKDHGFNPTRVTMKQYKTKLKEWKLAKYVPSAKAQWMSMKASQRKAQQQKNTVFQYQDRVLTEDNVRKLVRDPDACLNIVREVATPTDVKYSTPRAKDCEEDVLTDHHPSRNPRFEDFTEEDPFAEAALACSESTEDLSSAAIVGLVCELKVYEMHYNARGQQIAILVGKEGDWCLPKDQDLDLDSALVLVRFYTREKQLDRTELLIQSPYLVSALQNVMPEYPGTNIQSTTIVIRDLPMCVFHYRKELQAYGSSLTDNVAIKHLGLLLKYTSSALKRHLERYYTSITSNDAPGLDFEDLWMAFRPGDLLYNMNGGSSRIMRLVYIKRRDSSPKAPWKVTARQINFDGTKYGYQELVWDILPYEGYVSLNQLDVFPLDYHRNSDDIKIALEERGKKFFTCFSPRYREYHGAAHDVTPSQSELPAGGRTTQFSLLKTQVNSRVMVDYQGFEAANPSYSIPLIETLSVVCKTAESHLKEDQYLLCSNMVPGFSFSDKKWCMLEVDLIKEIKFNDAAFRDLIILKEHKDVILALVSNHNSSLEGEFDDIIAGKGKGLVVLLEGPPGTGKTLTAESVAEHRKLPLYNLCVSDLLSPSKSLQQNVSEMFRMAARWQAVLLIDEADTFLEERRTGEYARNTWASVLMRELEYYTGILFLTTSRTRTLDDGIQSRIHLRIRYDSLSWGYRRLFWKTFITRTFEEPSKSLDDKYFDKLSIHEFNGRHIRNIISVARHLASRNHEQKTNVHHIKESLETALKFQVNSLGTAPKHRVSTNDEFESKRRRLASTGAKADAETET